MRNENHNKDDLDFANSVRLAYDRLSMLCADNAGIDTRRLTPVFVKHSGWWMRDNGYDAYQAEFRNVLMWELLRGAVRDWYGWDIDECQVTKTQSVEQLTQYRGTWLYLDGKNINGYHTVVYREIDD